MGLTRRFLGNTVRLKSQSHTSVISSVNDGAGEVVHSQGLRRSLGAMWSCLDSARLADDANVKICLCCESIKAGLVYRHLLHSTVRARGRVSPHGTSQKTSPNVPPICQIMVSNLSSIHFFFFFFFTVVQQRVKGNTSLLCPR